MLNQIPGEVTALSSSVRITLHVWNIFIEIGRLWNDRKFRCIMSFINLVRGIDTLVSAYLPVSDIFFRSHIPVYMSFCLAAHINSARQPYAKFDYTVCIASSIFLTTSDECTMIVHWSIQDLGETTLYLTNLYSLVSSVNQYKKL